MREKAAKKGIIYCRVSSVGQVEGTSLAMQKDACLAYCKTNNILVSDVFIEKGESAKTTERTEFIKAIDICKQAKGSIDYFIVWKIDRFARHTSDHFRVKTLLSQYGVSIRSVTEIIGEDPQGHLMETILAGFAQFDNDIRAIRSRNGMAERMRQGIWVWRAPLGYKRTHKGANLSIDPKTAPIIHLIFETYATGTHTYQSVADVLKRLGHKTATGKYPFPQQIEKIVRNPIYCGIIRAWGEEHKAAFEPIIDMYLFNKCQNGYKDRIRNGPRKIKNPDFPLRRLIACSECYKPLTASTSTGRHGKKYPYYHHQHQDCPNATFIPRTVLEETFTTYLQHISPTLKYEAAFKAVVTDICDNDSEVTKAAHDRHSKELVNIEKERKRIFDAHRTGIYSDAEFIEQKSSIDQRIMHQQANKPDNTGDDFDINAALDFCLSFTRDSASQWHRLGFPEKLRFQKLVFSGNIPFDGKNFGIAELSPIYTLHEEYAHDESNLVTRIRADWNLIRTELQKWLEFHDRLNGGEEPSSQCS
jgi:site-specific DNA recombinase